MRCQGDASRNHQDDETKFLARILDLENPRKKENGDRSKGLETDQFADYMRRENKTKTDLEHLDVGYAQIKICRVAENQTAREHDADRQDGLDEHVLCDSDVLGSIEQVRCPLQNAGTNGLRISR